jgi:hypothetical protein
MTVSKPFAIALSVILSFIVLGLGWSIYETSTVGNDSDFIRFADDL